jgi:hypothetical protein
MAKLFELTSITQQSDDIQLLSSTYAQTTHMAGANTLSCRKARKPLFTTVQQHTVCSVPNGLTSQHRINNSVSMNGFTSANRLLSAVQRVLNSSAG